MILTYDFEFPLFQNVSWSSTSRVYGPKDFVAMVSSIKVVTAKGF